MHSPADDLELAVRRCAARTFGVPLEDVPPDLAFGALPEWDSVGHVDLMAAIDELLGVRIALDRFAELLSVPAIVAYVRERRSRS